MSNPLVASIVLIALTAIAGFLMCVGAVSTIRWIARRSGRRRDAVLYPPAASVPVRHFEPSEPTPPATMPLRPDRGPRDWTQRP